MDLDKALNRKEIARRDCAKCGGKGWTGDIQNQTACLGPEEGGDGCGGTGFQEKEVPYDFALGRNRTPGELAHQAWPDEVSAPAQKTPPPPMDENDQPFVPPKI